MQNRTAGGSGVGADCGWSWQQCLQLNSYPDLLTTLLLPQRSSSRPIGGCQGGECGVAQLPLFGGVFQGKAREFSGLVSSELVRSGGAGMGISHLHQSGAAAGEFGDDGGDVARVAG
jgi:hypothetical protein